MWMFLKLNEKFGLYCLGSKKRSLILTFSTERQLQGWDPLNQGGGNLEQKLLWNIFCKLLSSEPRKGTPISPVLEGLPGSQQCNYCGQSNTQWL